jgi:acetyl esterase/lipase
MKNNSIIHGVIRIIPARAARFLAVLFLAALFAACTMDPEPEPADPIVDLPYGSAPAQTLDAFFPPRWSGGPLTGLLYIHGGAWIQGDKGDPPIDDIRKIAAENNCALFSMNYRMVGDRASCEDMLEDVDLAIRYIRTNSPGGARIDKLVLLGVSAGAHLSLLYSYQHHAASADPSPIPIALCISLSGPTDFSDPAWYAPRTDFTIVDPEIAQPLKLYLVSALTGTPFSTADYSAMRDGTVSAEKAELLRKISPIAYVSKAIPPTLLVHGAKDGIVPQSNATRLKAELERSGAPLPSAGERLTIFPNSGHMLDRDPDKMGEIFRVISENIGKL